jgi:SAM-dependent methyltransferase
MGVEFTAHNIRLDDGTFTRSESSQSMAAYPWFLSARRVLDTLWPGDKKGLRLVDLGCLEGGYAVEFARLGFDVLGVEVREENFQACRFVKSKVDLPNLEFVKDDVWNLADHGVFDVVFCCGLFYHVDRPRELLNLLASVTSKLLILQTHFSTNAMYPTSVLPYWVRKLLARIKLSHKFSLSRLTKNEGLPGRWYTEYSTSASHRKREGWKWASWDNRCSFWIQREHLLGSIKEAGFDLVMEQFDSLGPSIADSLEHGYYKTDHRGTFLGVKTGAPTDDALKGEQTTRTIERLE